MTNNNHPITPPPELIREWSQNRGYSCADELWDYLATQAARWGADQELDACCEWFSKNYAIPSNSLSLAFKSFQLRVARRPKPPSLKEQAMDTLHVIRDHLPPDLYDQTFLIRRALESLPD